MAGGAGGASDGGLWRLHNTRPPNPGRMRGKPQWVPVSDGLRVADESPPTWHTRKTARWETKRDWVDMAKGRDSEDTREVEPFNPPPAEASSAWKDGGCLSPTDLREAVLAHPSPGMDPDQTRQGPCHVRSESMPGACQIHAGSGPGPVRIWPGVESESGRGPCRIRVQSAPAPVQDHAGSDPGTCRNHAGPTPGPRWRALRARRAASRSCRISLRSSHQPRRRIHLVLTTECSGTSTSSRASRGRWMRWPST